jgi:hypothetical protein
MPATELSSVTINGDTPQIYTGSSRLTGAASGTGNPVMGDPLQAAALVTVQAVAVASNTQQVNLPLGARILAITFLPVVAFTGTTPTVSVGTTSGGAQIVAATAITNAQVVAAIALGAAVPLAGTSAGGSPIFITVAQGATQTAVGTATAFIEYVMA